TSSDAATTFTGVLARVTGENAGAYAIEQGTLSAGSNYTINFVSANLTITAKTITVTANAQTKVFGAVDPALTYTSSDAAATFTGGLVRVTGENVGTYAIEQGALTGRGHYSSHVASAYVTITVNEITVTAK